MKKLYTLSLLVLLISVSAHAQNWTWKAQNGPFGAQSVNDFVIHSSGAYLAATTGGLFRSTDNGSSWSRIPVVTTNNQNFQDLEIAPNGTIYLTLAFNTTLYTSTNGGVSFSPLVTSGLPTGPKKIKVAPNKPTFIYAIFSGSGSVYRSTNSGSTFTFLTGIGSFVNDIEVDASSNNTVFIATNSNSVQYSTNDGVNFSLPATTLSSTASVYSIALDASNNIYAIDATNKPYRSVNGGVDWTAIKGTIPDATITGLIDTDASNNLYVVNTSSGKIYSSSNPTVATPTWSAGVSFSTTYGTSCVYFQNSTTWFIGRAYVGIEKTTNSGTNWAFINNGLKGHSSAKLLYSNTNRLFYAFGGTGYFTSLDEGANWSLISTGTANRNFSGFAQLTGSTILSWGANGVATSFDNGSTWTLQNAISVFNIITPDGTNLYYWTGSAIFKSTNSGATWTNLNITGFPAGSIQNVISDSGNTLYFSFFNSTSSVFELYKVTGTTAAKVTAYTGTTVTDLKTYGTNIYVLDGNNLWKSINGGTNWTSKVVPTCQFFWLYDDNNIFIQGSSTSTGFQVSSDGGSSWQPKVLVDSPPTIVSSLVINPSTQYAYAATNFSTLQKSSTPVVLPAAPTGLAISAKSVQSVDLVWNDNSTNETAYTVETSVGNNTSYSVVATYYMGNGPQNKGWAQSVPVDSVTNTFIRIRAYNDAGNSAYSNEISSTSFKNCTSTLPDNRSWSAVSTADAGSTPSGAGPFTNNNVSVIKIPNTKNQFTVSLYDLGVVPNAIHGSSNSSAIITEVCGQTYFFDESNFQDFANGNGTWNGTNTFTLKWQSEPDVYDKFQGTTTFTLNATDPVPASPVVTVYNYSANQVLVTWLTVPYATQYIIQRSTTSGSYSGNLATVNYPTGQYFDNTVSNGTTYYYRITAKNATGSSVASSEVSITPGNTLFTPLQNDISKNYISAYGVTWADLDNDGDEDYILAPQTNVDPPLLYENVGGGVFTKRTVPDLQSEPGVYSMVNAVDSNNDGKIDLFCARFHSSAAVPDFLLVNNGSWSFTKLVVPGSAGINNFVQTTWADYDQDGLLDLYDSYGSNPPTPTGVLLKNAGSNNFVPITTGTLATQTLSSFDVSNADYDNDGLQDLLVLSFTAPEPSQLYKNVAGTLTKVTGSIFDSDIFNASRTASWGDIDNDGDLDLFIGSRTQSVQNRLYKNNGDGTFTFLSANAASETGTVCRGSAFGDIDNDGDLDLITGNTNGANSIFFNDGTGTFTKYTGSEIVNNPTIQTSGITFADYDKNGFLDVAFSYFGSSVNLPNFILKSNKTTSASANWTQIKLVGTQSNTAAIGARITVKTTSPARTQIREVSSRTGSSSQSSLIQHFGLGTATTISQITIKWPNGGVQTWNNPPAAQTVNQILTIAEDITGPTFTSFTPANGATGVLVGSTLSLTLNEAGTTVAGKNIVVRKGSATATPVQTINASTASTGTGNSFSFTLAAPFDALTQYFISIDAGAFVDTYGNASLAVAPTQWSFTTLDNVAPVIAFTPVLTLAKGNVTGQTYSVTATDNVGIASVVMSYRKATATQFQTLNGTFNSGTNKYDFPLQATFFDEMGMEYFFTAKDGSNNSAVSPATGNYVTRLSFSSTTIAVGVAAGSVVTDYKIISIPLDLASNNIANIFVDFGAPDATQWKLLKYRADPQAWLSYPNDISSIARGEGYFIISRAGKNLKFDGATAPAYTQSNLFQLNLVAGFNLVGNPYTMPINWEDSRAGISGVNAIKVYQSGNYVDGNSIDAFSGGFVFANAAVTVPVKLKTSVNGGRVAQNFIAANVDLKEWVLPITMTQDQRQFNFGGVGMSPGASNSYDPLDDLAPPSPNGVFEMSFAHPEHFMKSFSKDVVPTQDGFTWNFTVKSDANSLTTLHWSNSDMTDTQQPIYLLDVTQQHPINMKKENSYTFSPASSSEFKIYFGKDSEEKLSPNRVLLGQVSPNPASGVVTIPFNLPDATSNFDVQLDVYDMLGRHVEQVFNQNLSSGFYSIGWDSRVHAADNGVYIIKMNTVNRGKQEILSTKLVILK